MKDLTKKEKYMAAFKKAVDPAMVAKHLQGLSDLPNELPDWVRFYRHSVIGIGEFRMDIPYDPAKLAELESMLGDAWVHADQGETYNNNQEHFYAHPSGCILSVIMDAKYAGSTVKLVKVGEKVSDIYEVSGAKENAC